MVDIELTNICNMSCVMCPNGNGTMQRDKGIMSASTLIQIISNGVRKHRTPVRFIRWGEPTCHPQWKWMAKRVREAGCLCHMNTNGLSLTEKDMRDVVDEKLLDSIKFSFQGAGPTGYAAMRNANRFDDLVARVTYLKKYRNRKKSRVPYIQVGTTITSESKQEVEYFRQLLSGACDGVFAGRTTDLNQPHGKICQCPEVFGKLSVDWDGGVTACCGDWDRFMLLGNVWQQSLEEIWNGPQLAGYRQKLLDHKHKEMRLCSRCARANYEL